MSTTQQNHDDENQGVEPSFFIKGVNILLGLAGQQPLKSLTFTDTVKSFVKTTGGSLAMSSGTTTVTITMNEQAAQAMADAEAEVLRIGAGADAEATRIGAQADAALKTASVSGDKE